MSDATANLSEPENPESEVKTVKVECLRRSVSHGPIYIKKGKTADIPKPLADAWVKAKYVKIV